MVNFNIQEYLQEMREEQREDNAALTRSVQHVLDRLNEHVVADTKTHAEVDARLLVLEHVNRNLGKAFGIGLVGLVGLIADVVRSHFIGR
jgi:hypothetical protein